MSKTGLDSRARQKFALFLKKPRKVMPLKLAENKWLDEDERLPVPEKLLAKIITGNLLLTDGVRPFIGKAQQHKTDWPDAQSHLDRDLIHAVKHLAWYLEHTPWPKDPLESSSVLVDAYALHCSLLSILWFWKEAGPQTDTGLRNLYAILSPRDIFANDLVLNVFNCTRTKFTRFVNWPKGADPTRRHLLTYDPPTVEKQKANGTYVPVGARNLTDEERERRRQRMLKIRQMRGLKSAAPLVDLPPAPPKDPAKRKGKAGRPLGGRAKFLAGIAGERALTAEEHARIAAGLPPAPKNSGNPILEGDEGDKGDEGGGSPSIMPPAPKSISPQEIPWEDRPSEVDPSMTNGELRAWIKEQKKKSKEKRNPKPNPPGVTPPWKPSPKVLADIRKSYEAYSPGQLRAAREMARYPEKRPAGMSGEEAVRWALQLVKEQEQKAKLGETAETAVVKTEALKSTSRKSDDSTPLQTMPLIGEYAPDADSLAAMAFGEVQTFLPTLTPEQLTEKQARIMAGVKEARRKVAQKKEAGVEFAAPQLPPDYDHTGEGGWE